MACLKCDTGSAHGADSEPHPPPTHIGGGAMYGYSTIDRFSAEDLPCCPD